MHQYEHRINLAGTDSVLQEFSKKLFQNGVLLSLYRQ